MRGHIRTRTKAGRPVYMATFEVTDPATGQRRQRSAGTHRTRRAAEEALTAALGKVQRGTWSDPSKMTLHEFLVEEWLATLDHRPNTLDNYAAMVQGWIIPALGGYRLTQLTPEVVRAFLASLKGAPSRTGRGEISDTTAAYVGSVLRIALAEATRRGLLQRNPATNIKRPKVQTAEMKTWTAEEAQRFEESVRGDRLHALWVLAMALGMRRGELLGARWADIDLEGGLLSVRQQLHEVRNGRGVFGKPKTDRSIRRLALDPRIVATLRQHRARQLEERMAWGPGWTDSGLVFTREDGSPIPPRSLTQMFGRLVRQTGLRVLRFHDLRHTHATLSLLANQHPTVVAARLGHSVTMLTDRYSHVLETVAADSASEVAGLVLGKTLTIR